MISAEAMKAALAAVDFVVVLVANLALIVQYGNNVILVHARKWFNGERCMNDGNVGSNSSTVAPMFR